MNRTEILDFLNFHEIEYKILEHVAADTIEEIESFGLPGTEHIVKNLFLRDEKKRNYYLLVVRKDKIINLKELRLRLGARPLSFASEDELFDLLGLFKGSVTPFGVLNDKFHRVNVIMDEDVFEFPVIGVHPNENTSMVWISPDNLKKIIVDYGNSFLSLKL